MSPVVLGIDPQMQRLGLALVEFEPPYRALWAETLPINLPDAGWTHQQIGAALLGVVIREIGGPSGVPKMPGGWEITRVGIELPPYVNSRKTYGQLCQVFALVCAEAHRRWPHAPQIPLQPAVWKKAALGKGNASKAEVMAWACRGGDGARIGINSYDDADALAIAVAAAQVELEWAA